VPKVGRVCTKELRDFCLKHGITFEWLLEGHLDALLWMTRQRHTRAVSPPPATVTQPPRPPGSMLDQEFRAKLEKLDESGREFIKGYMQALLDQRGRS
jgi:hypothetical protein